MTADRSVLVTGASRGIGRAIALRIARDGFDVVVHCRSRVEEAQAVATEIQALGQQARVLAFDVADRAAARAALEDGRGSAWRLLRRGLQCRHRP